MSYCKSSGQYARVLTRPKDAVREVFDNKLNIFGFSRKSKSEDARDVGGKNPISQIQTLPNILFRNSMATQFENPDPSALVEELRALQNAGSLLFHACLQGNIQEVRDLVEAGAPLWYQEPNSGWTCLHVAAESNDFATIKLLLDSGTPWSAGA